MDKGLIKAAMEYGRRRWQVESWDTPNKTELDYMAEEVYRFVQERTRLTTATHYTDTLQKE